MNGQASRSEIGFRLRQKSPPPVPARIEHLTGGIASPGAREKHLLGQGHGEVLRSKTASGRCLVDVLVPKQKVDDLGQVSRVALWRPSPPNGDTMRGMLRSQLGVHFAARAPLAWAGAL